MGISSSFLNIKQMLFLDTLIRFFFKIMKINNFRGELTDISAEKVTLKGNTSLSTIPHHVLYTGRSRSTLELSVTVHKIKIDMINTVSKSLISLITRHLSCSLKQLNSWQLPQYEFSDAHISQVL